MRELHTTCGLTSMLALAAGAAPAAAQQCHQEIAPANIEPGDHFGESVAIDGDRAVAGALEDGNSGPGGVWVFERGPAGWTIVAELRASEGTGLDRFGTSVALDGDLVAIGAPWHDGAAANGGAVYVFRRNGSVWVEEQRLFAPDPGFLHHFGQSVALEGDLLVTGSPASDELGNSSGAAHAFVFDGTNWNHRATLLASDGSAGAEFGCAVAISEGRILVGARGDDEHGPWAGAAYVFEEAGGALTETAKLVASDATAQEFFGAALALDGGRALIAAPQFDGTNFGPGAVYAFELNGSSWVEVERIRPSDVHPEGFFGSSVALVGDTAVVGSRDDSSLGLYRGAAFVLRRTPVGWIAIEKLHPISFHSDRFGAAVAVSAEVALVGGPRGWDAGPGSGSVHAYELACICGTLGESLCFGDGSGTACPCGNASLAGEAEGCENSTGRGAFLGGFGTASVASDDLTLCAEGLRPGPFTALLAGTAPAGGGIPFGDGLRCVDGAYFLLDSRPAGPDGTVVYGPGLGSAGGWGPGDQRYFQVQYRDPAAGPCGTGFNLSQAVSITFEP